MDDVSKSTQTLLVLGASGDMVSRLLLPAVGQLLDQQSERRLLVVGTVMEELSHDDWLKRVRASFATVDASGPAVEDVLARTSYHRADVTDTDQLRDLIGRCEGTPAIYFALPPAVTARVCTALADLDLPDGIQLALEKPFGVDPQSAEALNAQLADLVSEAQVHRVDHFLGRSTVLNLLGLRFANRIFEPLWNRDHIASVDIVYDEVLGLEGRAGYYDHAGALVDMIQSHLLQVMAVVAMEPPSTLGEADIRGAKAAVLRATRVAQGSPEQSSRRARYTAGEVDGRSLPAYVDEPGVDPTHQTETLAEVTFEIDSWRWAGVPFTLRSGKALGARRREIAITFRPVPHLPVGLTGTAEPTVLRIYLAPDQLSLELTINGEGDPYDLSRTVLGATFGEGRLSAYGEVLEGILDRDPALAVRGDTAVQCWTVVEPVVQAWRDDRVPLEEYPAGTSGPDRWPALSLPAS